MSGLLETCDDLFGSNDLYTVLGVSKSASQNEVKRGYHKLSLKVHPDRVKSKEKANATIKFQALGKVYSILSDEDKRALYDESGEVEEDDGIGSNDKDWDEYWRLMFKKISVDDIKQFEEKYKGSDEELADLKSAYIDYKGNMDKIIDNVLCSSVDDEPRFREILDELIKNKEVKKYKAFTNETARKRNARHAKASSEADEAMESRRELGVDDDSSLSAMILARNETRARDADSFFKHLEEKYGGEPEPKKTKVKAASKKSKK